MAKPQVNWECIARRSMHTTKSLILDHLVRVGEDSPSSIAEAFGEPLGNISYHTKVLLAKGLLTPTRTEPRRGAVEHYYRLSDLAGGKG